MLAEYLDENSLLFVDDVADWQEAVTRVAQPLLVCGAIEQGYVDAMLTSIADGGTYMDIGYKICLAHARPESGVKKTGVSALWVRPDVLLNDEEAHPIALFFCLAAADDTSHLAAMAELAQLLSDDDTRTQLLNAHTAADVTAVLNRGEDND